MIIKLILNKVLLLTLISAISLTAYGTTPTDSDVESLFQFIYEHPAVGKILQNAPGRNTLPIIDLANGKLAPSDNINIEIAPTLPYVLGNIVNSSLWSGRYQPYGVYEFRPEANLKFDLIQKGSKVTMDGNGGGILIDDKYYLLNWGPGLNSLTVTYSVYDANNWELLSSKQTNDHRPCATDLAYDRINGVIYGCFFRDDLSGHELGTIEFNDDNPVKTTIGHLPFLAVALGVNSKGELYGIFEDGVLYKINKTTAELTKIGDTGIKVASNSGIRQMTGEFDQNRDIFYWAANDIYNNWSIYTVDVNTAELTTVATIPDNTQILNMQILPPEASEDAPGELIDYDVSFIEASLTGNISFTVPISTYGGSALNGPLQYKISVDGNIVAQSPCTAGQKVETTILANHGMNLIESWVENETGSSPMCVSKIWVGYDVPVVSDVELVTNDHIALITWKASSESAHGGYMNGSWFKITRMPDNVVVADHVTGHSYTDVIPADIPMAQYSYLITACNDDVEGLGVESNKMVVGPPLAMPYIQTFDTEQDFDTMTVIDGNKDGTSWMYDSYYHTQRAMILNWDDNGYENDDWLMTPMIQLEAGKQYKVSLLAKTTTSVLENEGLEVKYGYGNDMSAYITVIPLFKPESQKEVIKEGVFEAEKNQVVRFGVHRLTSVVHGTIRIDDLKIEEISPGSAPNTVNNLTVTPGKDGNLTATVKFDTPTIDKDGTPLKDVIKTDIIVDKVLNKTIDTPEIGRTYSIDVDLDSHGFHTFQIVCHNHAGAGKETSMKAFVGMDKPVVENVKINDDEDKIIVTWNLAEKGANDIYVDPSTVTYNIYAQSGIKNTLLANNIKGNSCEIAYNTMQGEQGAIKIAVSATNEAGESRKVSSNQLIVGAPYELPYEEHFDNTSIYGYEIKTTNFFKMGGGISSDGDESALVWVCGFDSDTEYKEFTTLKITAANSINPRLSLDYAVSDGKIEVYVIAKDGSMTSLGELINNDGQGWLTASFDLSQWKDDPYFRLYFKMLPGAETIRLAIDNLKIQDVVYDDLDIKIALSNSEVPKGKAVDIFASVQNRGLNTSEEYKINFYINDRLIDSKEDHGLEFTKEKDYHFAYVIPKESPSILDVKLEAEYSKDNRPENNLAYSTIKVLEPKVSAPENLTGEYADGVVYLEWEPPTEFYSERMTESFESYSPWTITNFGDWTNVDVDHAPTIVLGGGGYPNAGSQQGWTIFNPESIGMTSDMIQPSPHAGSQYLACVAADVNNAEHNDDWFISPLLPGTNQEISFFAKAMLTTYGNETIQLLVSSKSKEIEDFELLEEYELDNDLMWNQYSAQLPAGTLYFAFRLITRDGYVCMIDDVTFTKGSCQDIISYNIYCDDILIGQSRDKSFEYKCDSGIHKFNVTAVYATGEESAYSNGYTSASSIDEIIVDGTSLYDIYSLDGHIVCLKGESIKFLDSGIYIVNGYKYIINK